MTQDQADGARDRYGDRTAEILAKLGPGPRIHMHAGVYVAEDIGSMVSEEHLRQRIVAAQERLLDAVGRVWDADTVFAGEVLDLGCGLGGPAIYWAQRHDVRVTAVTNVPDHVPVIRRLAGEAGVATRVTPVLADATDVAAGALPGGRRCRTAVAMESLCFMPRDRVFAQLARVVEPGGWLCVEDLFVTGPRWRELINAGAGLNVGDRAEYLDLARRHGFELDREEDLTEATRESWFQQVLWTRFKLAAEEPDTEAYWAQAETLPIRFDLVRACRDGALQLRVLRLRRTAAY